MHYQDTPTLQYCGYELHHFHLADFRTDDQFRCKNVVNHQTHHPHATLSPTEPPYPTPSILFPPPPAPPPPLPPGAPNIHVVGSRLPCCCLVAYQCCHHHGEPIVHSVLLFLRATHHCENQQTHCTRLRLYIVTPYTNVLYIVAPCHNTLVIVYTCEMQTTQFCTCILMSPTLTLSSDSWFFLPSPPPLSSPLLPSPHLSSPPVPSPPLPLPTPLSPPYSSLPSLLLSPLPIPLSPPFPSPPSVLCWLVFC